VLGFPPCEVIPDFFTCEDISSYFTNSIPRCDSLRWSSMEAKMKSESRLLLSVREFAGTLNITVACARRWILERRVTTVKLGRLVRVPASEVDRLISFGTRPARAAR